MKSYDTWPEVNKTVNFFADEHKRLQLNPGQGASVFTSDLTGAFDTAIAWNEYATDELYSWQDAIVGMVGNDALRAQFITEPLEVDMEINGTINVNIEAKADYPTGILSANAG